MQNIPNASWRDSARPVKFFLWDAQTSFPMLLLLIHFRLWTFELTLAITCFFTILNRYGFSIHVFGRWLRSVAAGRRKMSIPWWLD